MTNTRMLLARIRSHGDKEALVQGGRSTGFSELMACSTRMADHMTTSGVRPSSVVGLRADYSPEGIAALLAVIGLGAVAVPLTPQQRTNEQEYFDAARVTHIVDATQGTITVRDVPDKPAPAPLLELYKLQHPGLVLFTSGSTGVAKAALHDFERFALKFLRTRQCLRTLGFLMFDHIGGLDTLFYSLSNGSCLIIPEGTGCEAVCQAIAQHRVQVLPVSPSFVNLLRVTDALARHDCSSIEIVTYGAEVMSQDTLDWLHARLPRARLLQRFGMTELGAVSSRSRDDHSLWLSIGGDDTAARIVDGMLEIRSAGMMLGYLNAENPFTEDGWLRTGDAAIQDGEWIRILGRKSELINVGGAKVFPQEVEAVIEQCPGVVDVAVAGEPNALLGAIVVARILASEGIDASTLKSRVIAFCRERLSRHQIPQKIVFVEGPLTSLRSKKARLQKLP